jgi:hypothetical protein
VRPAPPNEPESEPSEGYSEPPAPEVPTFTIPDAPRRSRSAKPLGCFVGLLILAAVVAGPVIAIVSLVDTASDTIDGVTEVLDGVPTIETPETPAETPPPSGITGRSMIAPKHVTAVLKWLRADGVTSVERLVVRTDRTEAAALEGRRSRGITFHAEGGVDRDAARPANPLTGSIRVADIDAEVPARLVRNAAKRYPVTARGINYLIASPDDGGHHWVAYFKNGVYVEGDDQGRVIRRIS